MVKFLMFRGACKNGHLSMVKFLAENGADIHVLQEKLLGSVCKRRNLDIFKFLEK
jgi:Ankyrin repeat.